MATETENLATTTTATATNNLIEETPKKTLDLTTANKPDRNEDQPPNSSSPNVDSPTDGSRKDGEDSKSNVTALGSAAANNNDDNNAPVTSIQKKIRRAERFGLPVQLSEEEKRNSRAERFGTASTLQGSETSNNSEELKRKARAERFGLHAQPVASDEDAKKKARLARFSPYPKTDALEEDKRKARAIRFSKPSSSSLSEVNGKGNIEPVRPSSMGICCKVLRKREGAVYNSTVCSADLCVVRDQKAAIAGKAGGGT